MTREGAIKWLKEHHSIDLNTEDDKAHRMAIKALEQEPCEDAISRQAVLEVLKDKWGMFSDANDAMQESIDTIEALSKVIPQPKIGHWFYDKSIENWRCSECKETPKTMGYCGSANFMAEHFKFCNHCGAKMVESQENEDNVVENPMKQTLDFLKNLYLQNKEEIDTMAKKYKVIEADKAESEE